ncbi:MAG: aspartate aminotransferase family protein [Deltaproteobacteria bacterium HGW-Deltaproteobacteria-19]|jgi:adenosylmethionine-8-amino-7-oxononanoate aminotransferase|nr:MAG: aspartate aminotransferase family protein [Deltaproteobacteria bacterium HGW-Deltaproteobacteria-19]
MSNRPHLIHVNINQPSLQAVRGEGIYLYDADGNRYLDGCSGALVANLGHGAGEIARAMAAQSETLPYVFRVHFSSPPAEALAERYCRLTRNPMGAVLFTNSGSEAVETAVKLARTRHLSAGETDRHKIISRWQSYHGITAGALAWSGVAGRRKDFLPYFKDSPHIPPAYCYRCWYGKRPDACDLQCARALETVILTEGPETVSAFIAEPVVGAALAAATPPDGYFRLIREICDRYGVLFIADEVMTGAGRTGGSFFASDHFPGEPHIIAFGKGVGAGYYPLAGVLVRPEIIDAISAGSGLYSASQSHSAHPVGMAAGMAVLDYMEAHRLPEHAREMGIHLGNRLNELRSLALVGDIRGMGLMWGMELVKDKESREPFPAGQNLYLDLYESAREKGLVLLPSNGCNHGKNGDMALIAPPLIITRPQVDELVDTLYEALTGLAEHLCI